MWHISLNINRDVHSFSQSEAQHTALKNDCMEDTYHLDKRSSDMNKIPALGAGHMTASWPVRLTNSIIAQTPSSRAVLPCYLLTSKTILSLFKGQKTKTRIKIVKCAYKPGMLTTFTSNDDSTVCNNSVLRIKIILIISSAVKGEKDIDHMQRNINQILLCQNTPQYNMWLCWQLQSETLLYHS